MDLSKTLRLVGIVLDAQPKAIIERIAQKETVFLSKGETVEGAVLEDILEDKVILSYQDEKVELTQ